MSFFEPPPPPPEPPRFERPEWAGPPDGVIPGAFPLELVLARTDDTALYAEHGRAFPNGWQFTFAIFMREQLRRDHDPMMRWHAVGELSDDAVRLGIALADGRKATVFDRPPFGEDAPPPGAVLRPGGGGGGGSYWSFSFWAWPIPPEGPLDFVVEWPKQGIELTRTSIDSAPIRDASQRAQVLWPEAGPPRGQGGWVSRVSR